MADIARRQAERYTEEAEAREEAKAEKKRMKDHRRAEYMRSLLIPQWKSNTTKKFSCSEKRRLTAMEIMELVEDGTFTNQQAEVHFIKLEEPNTEEANPGPAAKIPKKGKISTTIQHKTHNRDAG